MNRSRRGAEVAGEPARVGRIDRLARALALAAGAILIGLVLLTVADVGLRYLFDAPIFGAHDITELGLILVVFGAMAYCGRSGGHVAVDVMGQWMGPRLRRRADVAVAALAAATFGVLAWRAAVSALDAAAAGEASNLLTLPYAPFYWVIALGAALYAVALAADALAHLRYDGDGG